MHQRRELCQTLGRRPSASTDRQRLAGGNASIRLTSEFRDREGPGWSIRAAASALPRRSVAASRPARAAGVARWHAADRLVPHVLSERSPRLSRAEAPLPGAGGHSVRRSVRPDRGSGAAGARRIESEVGLDCAGGRVLDACLMLCSTFAYLQFGKRFEIPAGHRHCGCRSAGICPRSAKSAWCQ